MPDQDLLLAEARKLGNLIATQPAMKTYQEIVRQLDLDLAAKNLLRQFDELMESLAAKEASMQPIEIAEKQKAQSLQQSIAIHPLLKRLMAAQTEYMELMRKVQEEISAGITQPASTIARPDPVSKLII